MFIYIYTRFHFFIFVFIVSFYKKENILPVTQMKSCDPYFKNGDTYISRMFCYFFIFLLLLLFRKPKYCCFHSVIFNPKHLSEHTLTSAR